MNNDNNTTSSVVVGCSSITTAATSNAIVGSGDVVNANDTSSSLSTIAGHSTTTISTTSPSIYTSASAVKSSAIPTNTPNDDKTKKSETGEVSTLKDWDDNRFKTLLEEAYSYKNPRDKENKSEVFLELLTKVQNEKEDQKSAFHPLTTRYTPLNSTSNSQKQGGSLQDLVEAESNDCDYNCGGPRNRRHNHNSRPKKYSSVSSRQREGGSLPSNVNVSNCSLSVDDQTFMNEEKSKQRRSKNVPLMVTNSTTSMAAYLSAGGGASPATAVGRGGNSLDGANVTTTTTSTIVCSSLPAEISLVTNVCTAASKNVLAGVVSGCGGTCEGAVGPLSSLAASIGNASSATCAALASATAIVSDSVDIGVTEMNDNYIDPHHDLISQGIQFDRFDGIEMKIPRANFIGFDQVLTRSDFSPNKTPCYVEEAVHFTTLERGKSTVDASYIPLDENYKACKSVLGEKSELVKMQSFSATKTISKQFDENGNSLNTTFTLTSQSQAKAKKKKPQSERNTKTLDVQSVEGYCGFYPVEVLVKYINSAEDTKQNEKVSKFADNSSKKKDKKKDKDKEKDKEKNSKMKRSNSLEELRSCSKLDGDDVTMRNKSNIKNKNVESKDKQVVPATGNTGNTSRKGERRSWGTEELTYLGENNAIEEVREKAKDKEKKKSKEKDKDFSEKLEKVVEKRKKSDANLVVSMESISCESAEFHVVTKKKKPKKQRQLAEEGRNNNFGNSQKNAIYQNRKYHSNFSNDRDAYITSLNNSNSTDKSRRKSTSSMPPSVKSDSSDLDSVHSLPIESAGGRSPLQVHHHHHHQNQPRSYAEIARKTETSGAATVVSPGGGGGAGAIDTTLSNTSSNSSNNSSHTELEINMSSVMPTVNTATKKSKKGIKTDFPDLIFNDGGGTSCSSTTSSNSTIVKQISYSQSLTSTGITDENAVDNVPQKLTSPDVVKTTATDKNHQLQPQQQHQQQQHQQQQHQQQQQAQQTMPLQKSKSVETDSFYNSIEQYPALEKTVKRHNSANSACGSEAAVGVIITTTMPPPSGMISVQMNNSINSNMGCITIGNPAPTSKKSKTTNTKVNEEVLVEQHQHQHQHQQHQTTKKSKKEKSHENYASITPQSTSSTTSFSASNINNKNQINYNHHNYNNFNNNTNKSSCSNSHNNNNHKSSSNSSSNKFSNRPAVIILNDDTTAGGLSSCIGNEFTFGDFNEEELRLFDDSQPQKPPPPPPPEVPQKRYTATIISSLQSFDDSGGNFNITTGSNASDMGNNSDDAMLLMQHTSSPNSSLAIDQSSDSGICNNFDGTKGKKTTATATKNQQTTIGTNTSAKATATVTTTTHRSSLTDNVINNAVNSSASTSPSKESLSSASSSSSSSSSASLTSSASSSSSSTYVENVPVSLSTSSTSSSAGKTLKSTSTSSSSSPHNNQQQQQQTQLENSKSKATLNSLCNARVSTMNKRNSQQQQHQQQQQQQQKQQTSSTNCMSTSVPSQQLETCDDIESAIIAAAKKAAAVAAEQTTTTSVINKNCTTKSSSSNIQTLGSTATRTQLNNINNNNSSNSNANHFNNYGSRQCVTSPPSSSSSLASLSNNKEYNRRGGGGGGAAAQQHQQRKEIDVHFIPPTLATPISSIQNNETIINFIGSAWEEVANSKVTQFYDGQ